MVVAPATRSPRGESSAPARASARTESTGKGFSGLALTINIILLIVSIILAFIMDGRVADGWIALEVIGLNLIGLFILFSLRVANQWEKAIVLRLGRFIGLQRPRSLLDPAGRGLHPGDGGPPRHGHPVQRRERR
jgi:multisubunit Na+/H+ antiporter MnhF subunit